MATSCSSVCFGAVLLQSTVLYIAELLVNGLFAHALYFSDDFRLWFLPYVGLLLLPLVTSQLVSAVLLLLRKAEDLSAASSAFTAGLHIMQLGFLWRHLGLLREKDPDTRSDDLRDLRVLNLLHTFTSMIPLLLIQTYFLLKHDLGSWELLAALVVTLVGSVWRLAVFQRHGERNEEVEIEWPGVFFRLLWRLGEIVSRVISLTVFATVYFYWIFLIFGLHWLTMLVCLCTSILGSFESLGRSSCSKLLVGSGLAYMYTFCFVNVNSSNTAFSYTLFYVIMFFENVVMTSVWYMNDDKQLSTDDGTLVFISGIAFLTSIVSMVMYYKCFHVSDFIEYEKQSLRENEGCINCKLSLCSKHNIKLQRPFSTGWLSQYQQTVGSGSYYRYSLEDPLLDSEWENEHDILNSSGEHCQIRDTDLESIRTNEKKRFTSVQASGTYTHKRFFDVAAGAQEGGDTESVTSGVYEEDWRHAAQDNLFVQLSVQDSPSLLSSQTQLLTDSWDNLTHNQDNTTDTAPGLKKIDILNSLIRKSLDSSFFSDGYTTDHTLDSYQLPVTVLARKRAQPVRRRVDIASSTASESTDCTICAFMNQAYSSPESVRRKAIESIAEEPSTVPQDHTKDTRVRKKRSERHHKSKFVKRTERSMENKHKVTCDRNNIIVFEKQLNPSRKETNQNNSIAKRDQFTSKSAGKPHSSKHPNTNGQIAVGLEPIKSSRYLYGGMPVSPSSAFTVYQSAERKGRGYSESPLVCASDSGDSAFPRHTPLSVYLAAADNNDQDGHSESSCEMII